MEDVVELRNRHNDRNYLKKIAGIDKCYKLVVQLPTVGVTLGPDKKIISIDPSGGSMISVGEYVEEANAVVDSIVTLQDGGFGIYFK